MNASEIKLGSDLLYAIMQDNGLSRQQMASRLGYTSKTSIDRIAQGTAGERALTDFLHRVEKDHGLVYMGRSNAKFNLMKSVFSKEGSHEWMLLFQNQTIQHEEIAIVDENRSPLGTFLDLYAGKQNLHLTLNGCISPSIISDIGHILQNPSCSCVHYIKRSDSGDNHANAIRSLIPIIFNPRYYAAVYDDSKETVPLRFTFPYNFIFLDYTEKRRSVCEALIFLDKGTMMKLPLRFERSFPDLLRENLKAFSIEPVIDDMLAKCKDDYFKYLHFCEELEHDRAVYQYKVDFGFEQIPPSIIRRCIEEGEFASNPEYAPFIDPLIKIVERRYRNSLDKAAPQVHVMKEGALWQLAYTGRMSDHFWGMRSFNTNERVQIFEGILARCESTEYQIHILEDPDSFADSEITLYDEYGLSILKPHTTYTVKDGPTETIVKQMDFCSSFKSFYLKELVPLHTLNKKDSVKHLRDLLSFCRERVEYESV